MLDKFSSMFHAESKVKSVYKKDEEIDLSKYSDLNDEFNVVSQYLTESLPLIIELPFEGTNLLVMERGPYYVFCKPRGAV
jgi:hypothetical protein